MKRKLNCWEIKQCGRQPGGTKTAELGICPATTDSRLNGIHGGENGGRACWVLSGTMCAGEVQGTFAQKYTSCKDCDVYAAVKEEESPEFKLSAVLLNMLNNN